MNEEFTVSKYSINVLFGLGFLYIQLNQAKKASYFLETLKIINPENKHAKILLCITSVMQGGKITVEEFNFARRYASPTIVQMLAKRTNITRNKT
jgi:hypothetical protein